MNIHLLKVTKSVAGIYIVCILCAKLLYFVYISNENGHYKYK